MIDKKARDGNLGWHFEQEVGDAGDLEMGTDETMVFSNKSKKGRTRAKTLGRSKDRHKEENECVM